MLRFSLGTLFLFICLVSFASAALGSATREWQIAAVSVCVVSLCAALVAALTGSGAVRAFGGGAAIAGGGNFALTISGLLSSQDLLLTDAALLQLYTHTVDETAAQIVNTYNDVDIVYGSLLTVNDFSLAGTEAAPYGYRQTGHACFSLLLAFLGGVSACGLDRWRRRTTDHLAAAESREEEEEEE